MTVRALDLFAGLGGMDLAAESLGWQADGVEIMPAALATRAAAGLKTVAYDVRTVEIRPGEYDAVLGGPPCQPFSMSGKGEGRALFAQILHAVRTCRPGADHRITDERSALVVEPLRLILSALPTFVVLEQVHTVLPVWQAYAERLAGLGYSATAGVLSAEQYGIPQTRKRAFLVARRDSGTAALPAPTHSRYHWRTPGRLDPGTLPWVSMESALDWAESPAEAVKCMGRGMVERYGARPGRPLDAPAFTIRGSAGALERGGFRWRYAADGGTRNMTQREALLLQTFPADFPVSGGVGARFLQIGNAVPPMLARAVLEGLTASPVRLL